MNFTANKREGFWDRIIVKFNDDFPIEYIDGAESSLSDFDREEWEKLKRQYPGITLNRLLTAAGPDEIRALVERAKASDPDYDPPNVLTLFLVDAPAGFAPAAVATSFQEWNAVQTAYADTQGIDPSVTPTSNPYFKNQGYLCPAKSGIGVVDVWPRPGNIGYQGADGEGINFIDVEQGWTLDHEDLAGRGAVRLHGDNRVNSQSHGTQVLGVVCAMDDTVGCVGIAPGIKSVNVVSYFGSTMANALLAAIINLEPGDVLLLEVQVDLSGKGQYLPIEVLIDRYFMIRLTTALGIIVIEAAGNGNQNLDGFTDKLGKKVLNVYSPDFRDSCAILVGASTAAVPHSRHPDSNFGCRVDCFAWGEGVATPDSDNTGSKIKYSFDFKRTSAASAIIAGAALVVQGAALANLNIRLSPKQMRAILSSPSTGTQSASASDRIGVMPDLSAIFGGKTLNLKSQVDDPLRKG